MPSNKNRIFVGVAIAFTVLAGAWFFTRGNSVSPLVKEAPPGPMVTATAEDEARAMDQLTSRAPPEAALAPPSAANTAEANTPDEANEAKIKELLDAMDVRERTLK